MSNSNPFTLLDVDATASKKEILHQVTVAMRARAHRARAIAEAQKQLFDPVARAAAEFEYSLDIGAWFGAFEPEPPATAAPSLEVLERTHEQTGTAQ